MDSRRHSWYYDTIDGQSGNPATRALSLLPGYAAQYIWEGL